MLPIGAALPDHTPHAVSVSLPTWASNVGYEEGDPGIIQAMQGGYPRFMFHPMVRQLMNYCTQRFGMTDETCLAFSTGKAAQQCRLYMRNRLEDQHLHVRIAEFYMDASPVSPIPESLPQVTVYIVLFPQSIASTAKEFWQHSGQGISSRFAEHCLRLLEHLDLDAPVLPFKESPLIGGRSRYHHESFPQKSPQKSLTTEMDTFVEERYGRNIDSRLAAIVKTLLRKRIAGVLMDSDPNEDIDLLNSHIKESTQESNRSINVTEEHVYLFPSGMSSIFNVHQLVLKLRPGLKSVQFGFPYIDTLKIQQKIGPGCHFFGHGNLEDTKALESLLQTEKISALFCEFPSNPLLTSPDLEHLYSLANKHDFLLVVDETIGNFCNVSVLPYADIVVSSLTKVFSGDSNVMGGSAVVNPSSRYFQSIQEQFQETYHDNLWPEDAVFLERNSRTFQHRIQLINHNAEAVCDVLTRSPLVEKICYPKYVCEATYLKHVRNKASPGYGGLFSVILKTDKAAHAFYDAIQILKGPSLGTNFTLACPYTILAHYTELDWALQYGVPSRLVRVSIGIEDTNLLLQSFEMALEVAASV